MLKLCDKNFNIRYQMLKARILRHRFLYQFRCLIFCNTNIWYQMLKPYGKNTNVRYQMLKLRDQNTNIWYQMLKMYDMTNTFRHLDLELSK